MKRAYILYLWLTVFTMFVTVFSIILFNYSAGDIKVTRKLMQDTQYYNTLKAISLISTELYRVGKYQGSWLIKGKNYNFKTKRITPTRLLVEIFDNSNNPLAKIIVQDRYNIFDNNLFVLDAINNEKLRFNNETSYDRFVTVGESEISIQASRKIFNISFISPQTVVNGKGIKEVKEKDREYYVYENLEEMKKYSYYAGIIDPGITSFLFGYFRNLRDFARNKSENNRTFPNEIADLTKYGSILISIPQNSEKTISEVEIKFNINPQRNQEVYFNVSYTEGKDNKEKSENYLYYLVRNPQTVYVNVNSLRTNDTSIIPTPPNNQNNQNNQNNPIPISLNPSNNFVYKVMIKLDENGGPLNSTIYKTAYDKTIIYVDGNVKIGSNSVNNFDGGKIGSAIILITPKDVKIKGHIAYSEFLNPQNFMDLAQNENFQVLNESKSYFNVVANNINIVPDNSYYNRELILNGDYVSFFNLDSKTNFNNMAKEIFYLGSNITSKRYVSRVEKIITDPRANNPINQYFMFFKIHAIDIKK